MSDDVKRKGEIYRSIRDSIQEIKNPIIREVVRTLTFAHDDGDIIKIYETETNFRKRK